MKDLYEILSVARDATSEEIRDAWKELSKLNHPDNGGSSEKQAEINEAYEILYDTEKRERYDRTGTIKDINFEARFQAILIPILTGMADNINPNVTDVIDELTDSILTIKAQSEKNLFVFEKRIKNTEIILSRMVSDGSGKLEQILNSQLFDSKKNKAIIEEDLDFLNKALELLENYDYNVDEQEDERGGWRPIKFRIDNL